MRFLHRHEALDNLDRDDRALNQVKRPTELSETSLMRAVRNYQPRDGSKCKMVQFQNIVLWILLRFDIRGILRDHKKKL